MGIIVRLIKDEAGATAIEYGLIAAGIALVIMAALMNTSTGVGTSYNEMSESVVDGLTP